MYKQWEQLWSQDARVDVLERSGVFCYQLNNIAYIFQTSYSAIPHLAHYSPPFCCHGGLNSLLYMVEMETRRIPDESVAHLCMQNMWT